VRESVWLGTEENVAWSRRTTAAAARGCPRRQGGLVRRRAWSAPQERVSRLCPSRSNSGAYGTPPPRARGRSEQGVCSSEACGIPAPMHRWGDQGEEEVGKACPRWVVTRDAAGRCAHESGNSAVVARTLVSLLHSQGDRTRLTGLARGVIASDVALQRTVSRECASRPQSSLCCLRRI
jgi:hypothetical protein